MLGTVAARSFIAGVLTAFVLGPCAVYAVSLTGNVKIIGNLSISGSLSKGSGTFEIDHPLDPANMILFHSFVESPDAKNMYDGVIELDSAGEATVVLPDYYDALNTDSRYELFPMYAPMPELHVKTEVKDNRFVIAGGKPGGTVSWQVTGIRHDPFILANPIIPEVPKSDLTPVKRGECLYPPLCE